MDFSQMIDSVIGFAKDSPIIAVAVGLLLLFLLIRKSKLFLLVVCLGLVLAAALYLITDIASVGKAGKGKMIQRGGQP